MEKSPILLLIIGSNTKRRGGAPGYQPATSILSALSPVCASRLVAGRRRVLRWVRRGGVSRHGVVVADMLGNCTLADGPEFGGTSESGRYLPAAMRFRGRFYSQLGPDSADVLINAPHHVLILTGLYGLVLPGETIQDHQCHIDDHPNFRRFWIDNDLMTDVLLAYIIKHRISHVYDLTAKDSYRFLVAWERIRAHARVVLHCFGEQSAGDELLTSMGALAAEMLSPGTERTWLSMQPGAVIEGPYDRIHFQPSPKPPPGAPREMEVQRAQLSAADELGRMRRCLIRIMTRLGADFESDSRTGVQEWIGLLEDDGRIPPNLAAKMMEITRARNRVEYRSTFRPTEPFLNEIRKRFSEVIEWAAAKMALPAECRNV